jgi:Uma2 family endonuclease
MSTARLLHYSYEEYLHALDDSGIKLEYWAGVIYALAGGTPEHGALAAKVISLLDAKLPAGCRPLSSDVKIRIPRVDIAVFPDASVVCGKLQRAPDDELAVVNPGLIVEVTSPSTAEHDRGEKLEQYKLIKSVQAVWLVSHASARVTVVERQGKTWKSTDHGKGARLTLATPALTIDVDAIYRALEGL